MSRDRERWITSLNRTGRVNPPRFSTGFHCVLQCVNQLWAPDRRSWLPGPNERGQQCGREHRSDNDPVPMIEPLLRVPKERSKHGTVAPGRRGAERERQTVVDHVEDDSRQQAPAAHREQSEHKAQQRGVEELVKQTQEYVEKSEEEGGQKNCGSRQIIAPESRENEPAKRKFLTDTGHKCQHEKRRLVARDFSDELVQFGLDRFRNREERFHD